MQSLNDTKEKGWGRLEPGDRIGALYELEIGKFYLRETFNRNVGFSYNVVEILPLPEDFAYIPGQELLYGCYVDPLDTSKPRRYNNGIFSIWWWEISKANDDAYYQIDHAKETSPVAEAAADQPPAECHQDGALEEPAEQGSPLPAGVLRRLGQPLVWWRSLTRDHRLPGDPE
jgi:hypothetical protein